MKYRIVKAICVWSIIGMIFAGRIIADDVPVYRAISPIRSEKSIGIRSEVQHLIQQGIDYFNTHDISDACHAISHSKNFVVGDLGLYIFKTDGTCVANGNHPDLIWQDLSGVKDLFGRPIVQNIIKTGQAGGGWVNYEWKNAVQVAYVAPVEKQGEQYVMGCGYYPDSNKEAVVSLVKSAVDYFNREKECVSTDDIFSVLSYPAGRFSVGPYYLFGLDFDGNIVLQGDRPGLIGENALISVSKDGRYLAKEMIELGQRKADGFWLDYTHLNAPKKSYVQVVTDTKGNKYAIAAGYYPTVDSDKAIDLVEGGYEYVKTHGLSVAVNEISAKYKERFKYGSLALDIYSLDGVLEASGKNPEMLGQKQWDAKDEDGKYFVREFIKRAKDGGGWVNAKLDHMYKSTYVKLVDLGVGKYVVACGIYANNKSDAVTILAQSGADYLRAHSNAEAFRAFMDDRTSFTRGDMQLFVFDTTGMCYVYGDEDNLIWQNMINFKDERGKLFVKNVINDIQFGATTISYHMNGAEKIAYVEPVEKDGKKYLVGSSYYPHEGLRRPLNGCVVQTEKPVCRT